MQVLSDLHKDILLRCSDDEVGLWEVVQVVIWDFLDRQFDSQESFTPTDAEYWVPERCAERAERERAIDPNLVREKVLHIVRDLLEAGLIDAGFPADHGRWDSWNLSPAETMSRIEAEWDALGHSPNIGDVVWFISTIEGDRVLARDVERNTAHES